MTLRKNHAQRRARNGTGLLPPNPKQWNNEHNGLDLRDALGLEPATQLCHLAAYALMETVVVVPHGDLPIAQKYIDHLRTSGKDAWSGMAFSVGEQTIVTYNDSHPPMRIRATLMEEFFHLWLAHPPSLVRVYTDGKQHRSINKQVEQEAYDSGAAALVPYVALKEALRLGESCRSIAARFQVSEALVMYRSKVTRLRRKR